MAARSHGSDPPGNPIQKIHSKLSATFTQTANGILSVHTATAVQPLLPQIPSESNTSIDRRHCRPILAAFIAATILHGLLFTIPVELFEQAPAQPGPIHFEIIQPTRTGTPSATVQPVEVDPETSSNPPTDKAPPEKNGEQQLSTSQPTAEPATATPATTITMTPPKKATGTTTQNPPAASTESSESTPENGAKTRSTVFDPRRLHQLQEIRDRVQKFQTRDTEYTTNNGRFIQKGDKCWEEKKLLPGDIDSSVTQRFNIKCSKRGRAQDDIDRLARKYGIP